MDKPKIPTKTGNRSRRFNGELSQEQILKEATTIMAQRGYNGFSIQEVAGRCGTTSGELFHFFGTKNQLVMALLPFRVSRDTAALAWLCGEDLPRQELSLEAVLKALRAIVEQNCTQPEVARFWTVTRGDALNGGHPAHAFFIERQRATLQRFAEMLAAHVAEPESTARQVTALMAGLEEQWLRENQGFDLLKEWDRGISNLLPGK